MAIPTRKQQIERVTELLELSEDKTLEEIATSLVDGYLDLMLSQLKKPILVPHVGMAFKHPALSGVWHVAYDIDGNYLWIVSATSKYGSQIPMSSRFWEYAEMSTAKAGAPGNNTKGWKVGDRVSRRQRQYIFDVVATSDKGVLLRDANNKGATPLAESNENMEQYYRKEVGVVEIEW